MNIALNGTSFIDRASLIFVANTNPLCTKSPDRIYGWNKHEHILLWKYTIHVKICEQMLSVTRAHALQKGNSHMVVRLRGFKHYEFSVLKNKQPAKHDEPK